MRGKRLAQTRIDAALRFFSRGVLVLERRDRFATGKRQRLRQVAVGNGHVNRPLSRGLERMGGTVVAVHAVHRSAFALARSSGFVPSTMYSLTLPSRSVNFT